MPKPNESREAQVCLNTAFCERVLQWHGGQSSGLYAVGSSWLAGFRVPGGEVQRAWRELSNIEPKLDDADKAEVQALKTEMLMQALEPGRLADSAAPDKVMASDHIRAVIKEEIDSGNSTAEDMYDELVRLVQDLCSILSQNAEDADEEELLEVLLRNRIPDGQILDNLGIRRA